MKSFLKSARRRIKLLRKRPRVWLLDKDRLAYIQIRKVASTSIRQSLAVRLAQLDGGDINQPDNDRVKEIAKRHTRHMKPATIRKQLAGDYYLFTFVRNPVLRAWSCYKNRIIGSRGTGITHILGHRAFHPGMDFPEFIDVVARLDDRAIDRHLCSQTTYLCDSKGLVPDFIGKLENFDHDWGVISERYSLPAISHRNRTDDGAKLIDACGREDIDRLVERYRQDIELLGYEQDIETLLKTFH